MSANSYQTFAQMHGGFPSVDLGGERLVVNLGAHRLIVGYNFQTQKIFFKHLLAHNESMREEWQS